MTEQLSTDRTAVTAQELPVGTIFNLGLPRDRQKTYVILGGIDRKFLAGRYLCAALAIPGDGVISLGPMQPLPGKIRPNVIGSLQQETVMYSLEQQFGDFGAAVLHWMDGSGPDPWGANQ